MRLPNLPKFDMTPSLFYKFGMWCFFIIAIGNLWSLIGVWEILDWGIRVAKIAGVGFNLILIKFFSYLKKTSEPQPMPKISDEDMAKVIEDLA